MNPHLQEREITTEEAALSPSESYGITESENRLQNEALASFFAGLVKKPEWVESRIPPVKETTSLQIEAARLEGRLRKNGEAISSLEDRLTHLSDTVETGIISKQKDTIEELGRINKALCMEVSEAKLEVAKLRCEKAELRNELVDKELEVSRLTNKLLAAESLKNNETRAIKPAWEVRWEYEKQMLLYLFRVKENLEESTKEQVQRTITAQELLAKAQAIMAKIEPTVTQDALMERISFLHEDFREKNGRRQSLQAYLEQVKRESPTMHRTTQSSTSPKEADV